MVVKGNEKRATMTINDSDNATGTRFRLYPQSPDAGNESGPETVYVSSPAGSLLPGPSDDRMYTVFPDGKQTHYGVHANENGETLMFLPPWHGNQHAPATPSADGHFDHLEPGTRQFQSAHLFGCARFTLDVWEGYFGRQIDWHFASDYDRLELSVLPSVDNAFLGWGFLEAGGIEVDNNYSAFFLNFDVIAHEVGHAIIYQEIGLPPGNGDDGEYLGFHESAGDITAMIASMHFDSVIDNLLESTSGNLYTMNRLTRFAETASHKQIRIAANDHVMSEFVEGWDDEHDLGEPLTGAVYDILIDVFHEQLLSHKLVPQSFEDMSDQLERHENYTQVMQSQFDTYYQRDPEGFRHTLLAARDYLGTYLADTWSLLDAETLSFEGIAKSLIAVDQSISGGRFSNIIDENFRLREIGQFTPGPRVSKPEGGSHLLAHRTMSPNDL